jgi:hypothetical protein
MRREMWQCPACGETDNRAVVVIDDEDPFEHEPTLDIRKPPKVVTVQLESVRRGWQALGRMTRN